MRNKKNKKRDNGTLKEILKYVKPYVGYVILSVFFALLTAVSQLLIPVFCGDGIDLMLGEGNVDVKGVVRCGIYVLVCAVCGTVAQQLLSSCNNKLAYCVSRDLRCDAVTKMQKLPLSYLDTHSSGDILSRIVNDVEAFSDGLLMGIAQLFTGGVTIIGTLVIMFSLNFSVSAIVVVLTPLSLFTASFIASKTHKYFMKQSQIKGEQTALINELVDGQKTVRELGHEKRSLEDFDEVNNRLNTASFKATLYSSLINPTTRLVNNIVYAFVGLVGAFYTVSGAISVGQFSAFLSYAGKYAKPFNEISGVVTELQNAFACASRVFELLKLEEIPKENENALSIIANGRVELENVSFRYLPERPLIENFSLKVEKGKKIAIVGPTGCGKTTLINLLMRFYDTNSGRILVDGYDIKELTYSSLRQNYGMVLQETWLKSGTVRENIAYVDPGASDEEIEKAARAAHAHSFIKRLPNGYDTVINEGGDNISAGQKQLLCIARAMLRLPQMLILDEATSSIDTRTEIKVQEAFGEMMRGRTSFVVAHRMSTIRSADVILVMKDGRVIEQGTHDELLKMNGFYSNLYNSQFEN